MEFFQCLYPKKQIRPLVKELKRLLDNLGEFQDREVQAEKLREFGRQMKEEGEVPSDTLLAMGMLVDGLLRSQQLARTRFADRFSEFAIKGNRNLFKELFAPGGNGGGG
jgi:CHAD domain-containing protein